MSYVLQISIFRRPSYIYPNMDDNRMTLDERMQKEGITLENMSTEEKILYVWRLYLDSEVR